LLWPALQPLLGGNCGRHVLGGPARTCRSRQIIRYGMMSTGAKPRWHPSDAASVDAGAMCGRQRHQRRFGRTPSADMRTSAGFRRCGPLSRHRRAEIPQCASSPAGCCAETLSPGYQSGHDFEPPAQRAHSLGRCRCCFEPCCKVPRWHDLTTHEYSRPV